MKEKILFISSNYPPRIGGPATTVPQVAKALSKDFDVSVIAFREKSVPNYEKTEFELFRSPSFYGFGFSNPLSVAIRTLQISLYARWILGKRNARIIHAHDTHISAISALFCKYTSFGKKVFVKYAGDLVLEYSGLSESEGTSIEAIFSNPTFKQKILLGIQKKIFNMADKLHVQNEYQANILKKQYNIPENKIIIIPNPINEWDFSNVKRIKGEGKLRILSVSRIVPWKGHEIAIKAVAILSKKERNIQFNIIGTGDAKYVAKLKGLCLKLGIEKNVAFLGKIGHENLPSYYARADIFVQPSLYEPFGITVIEAMACNLPIAASSVGGLKELVISGKNGFLAKPSSPTELASAILKAKNFEPDAKTNKKILNEFKLETIIKLMKQNYLKVIKK